MKTETDAALIDLSAAKEKRANQIEKDSIQRYLGALSFSELIDETSSLIAELNKTGSTKEMISQSKLVLKELGERFSHSHGLSESFLKMKKDLENRLS